MRLWFEVNQHKERSIRTFNEKGSEVEIIICQVILITARLIVLFNNLFRLHATILACSKMCLCVIYVIVRCCILVPGIYDSDLDPDTLDC